MGVLYDITAISATTAWACGQDGAIIKTVNGTDWSELTSDVGFTLHGIDFIDADNGWCVGEDGTILSTTDGGSTWAPEDSGTTRALLDVCAVDASHVWICGEINKHFIMVR